MKKENKKATKYAKEYIEIILNTVFQDCSDSLHELVKIEAAFDAIVDDKISIEDYVRKFLLKEYAAEWKRFVAEFEIDEEEQKNPSVCAAPIPYSEIKHLL